MSVVQRGAGVLSSSTPFATKLSELQPAAANVLNRPEAHNDCKIATSRATVILRYKQQSHPGASVRRGLRGVFSLPAHLGSLVSPYQALIFPLQRAQLHLRRHGLVTPKPKLVTRLDAPY